MTFNPEITQTRIRRAIREHGDKCAVACSWGKDSAVVLYLTLKEKPDVLVVHSNTGVDHKLTYEFRDRMVKEWSLNYVEVKGDKTYWQIIKEDGIQAVRNSGTNRVPKCCLILKDKPAEKYYKESGIKCVLTGITAAESRNRWMLQRRCGEYYYAKSQGLWKLHPIMDWTEEEVWAFIRSENIPYNEFYDKFPGHRCGCVPCTSYISWPERMAQENPRLHAKMMRLNGQDVFEVEQ